MKSFEELGIDISGIKSQGKTLCPRCSHTRKKSSEACLSVNIETGQFHCFNCGYAGGTKDIETVREHYSRKTFRLPDYKIEDTGLDPEGEIAEYLIGRGLSLETLEANFVADGWERFDREEKPTIMFPYIKQDVVNVKYRSLDKDFRMEKGAESCLYGIQNLFEGGKLATKKIFITEGEIDALSLYECGFRYALSVPSGASVEEEGRPPITPKLEYLEDPDMARILSEVDEVVLVTDGDYKGRRLKEELANRIGLAKCTYVEYPTGCKDINDVLVQHGQDKVIELVLDAQPMLQGLVTVGSRRDQLIHYYQHGLSPGLPCGIDAFDDIYTLQEGLITLVTGIPEIKKSVTMDNICVGYADLHDMHIACFSPETKPTEFHIGRLASIKTGKSLDPNSPDRMSYQEYQEATDWVDRHFTFLQPPHNTVDEILELARLSILKYGTKILVIDPYSRIRVDSEAEDKFIRRMLNDIAEFAVMYKVHVFIVAHPTKVETVKKAKDKIVNYPIVTPYMIKGASEWYQSADFVLSLWRDLTVENAPTKVYCLKSKFFHIATSNTFCELDYDFTNWRLTSHEIHEPLHAVA